MWYSAGVSWGKVDQELANKQPPYSDRGVQTLAQE
jgi:hypothetical protein